MDALLRDYRNPTRQRGGSEEALSDTDLYSAIVASNGEFLGTSPRLRVGL